MKLLVCGEGTSELGRPEQQGVVETLVRRCLETDAQRLTFEVVKVSQLPKDRAQAGEARRARQAIDEARRRQCDGFIYVRDADVVAVDQAWGIGHSGELPWPKLKGDLAHVRAITDDAPAGKRNAIIMGRRTWEAKRAGQKPSPRHLTVVVSRGSPQVPEGVLAARSLTEALYKAGRHDDVERVLVVGGAQLYRDALEHPRLCFAYLTRIAQTFECDAHLPSLEHLVPDAGWTSEAAGHHEDAGLEYTIERLKRS